MPFDPNPNPESRIPNVANDYQFIARFEAMPHRELIYSRYRHSDKHFDFLTSTAVYGEPIGAGCFHKSGRIKDWFSVYDGRGMALMSERNMIINSRGKLSACTAGYMGLYVTAISESRIALDSWLRIIWNGWETPIRNRQSFDKLRNNAIRNT